ncbi:MAG: segregation/condensation protein A [Planctomycetota bacterium]
MQLDAFEGPLDLLLHLIRRAEVDVHDIPIGPITDQYLAYLEDAGRLDIEPAGEFLVMAATLVEIKSRTIQPAGSEQQGGAVDLSANDEPDPRAELVKQLLEFKRYRDASEKLEERMHDWSSRHPAGGAAVDKDSLAEAVESMGGVELDELDVLDLVRAFERIVDAVDFTRAGEHEVFDDDTPIELHAEDIVDRLGRDGAAGRMTLQAMFEGRKRGEMLGLFLALLELLKQQRATVKQDQDLDAIVVELRPQTRDASATA